MKSYSLRYVLFFGSFFCLVVIVDVVAGSTRVLRSFNFIFRKFAFLLIVLLIFPVFVELTVSSKAIFFCFLVLPFIAIFRIAV